MSIKKENPKVDFVKNEHEILDYWSKNKTFEKLVEKNSNGPKWSFLDGVEDKSPAEEAGLQEGDIITRVGRKKIYSTKDFLSEMSKFDDESKVLFLVKRGSSSRFITITR